MNLDDLTPLDGASVLITGARGMLGRAFAEMLSVHVPKARVITRSHQDLDVTERSQVMAMSAERPAVILHCGGLADADRCQREPELAHRSHVVGTDNVIELAREVGAKVLYPQSVFIFDGTELPVTERTTPAPPFVYGAVKLEAERRLLATLPSALSVRMAGFFGGDDADKNFVGKFAHILRRMLADDTREIAVGDRMWQPTYTNDHAYNCLVLLARNVAGIFHMGALGEATFYEVADACVRSLGLSSRITVVPESSRRHDAAEPAPRPSRMVTANERLDAEGLNRQRPWREALDEYLARPSFDDLRRAGSS